MSINLRPTSDRKVPSGLLRDWEVVCMTCGAHLGAFDALPVTTGRDGALYVVVEHCGEKSVFPAVAEDDGGGS